MLGSEKIVCPLAQIKGNLITDTVIASNFLKIEQ